MVWVRLPVYFYKRNDTFYFSRSIPSDLQHRFNKRKIEVSLRTNSVSKSLSLNGNRAFMSWRASLKICSTALVPPWSLTGKNSLPNPNFLPDALRLLTSFKRANKISLSFLPMHICFYLFGELYDYVAYPNSLVRTECKVRFFCIDFLIKD